MTGNKDGNIYDSESSALIEITEKIMSANSYVGLRDDLAQSLSEKMGVISFFFQVAGLQPVAASFFSTGIDPEVFSKVQDNCTKESDRMTELCSTSKNDQPFTLDSFTVFPLWNKTNYVGLFGIKLPNNRPLPLTELWDHLLAVMANVIHRISVHQSEQKQLDFLNTYMSISSLLGMEIGLHEMLEASLNCCMDVFSAEAASILLLDNKKENFIFYQVEGEAKPALMSAKLPIDQGIAGAVLQSRQSEMVNDLANDLRFHKGMDEATNFHSRNMIAVPLLAGEEQVGVLEILNKSEGRDFLDEEHFSLKMLAEEIAFAIRNAKIFDYVVTSYCKQRQGLNTCKGCKRPLGTWTPCIKYRENLI